MKKFLLAAVLIATLIGHVFIGDAQASTASQIDSEVKTSLEMFKAVNGSDYVMKNAKGLLVFPKVFKAGFGIGGEFGEGALIVKGKTDGYYNTAAASIGFQIGVQKKTIIIAFMDKAALKNFQRSSGWKIGADASVAVIAVGAGGSIDSATANKPIIAFVFDQKGLMYNLTLEGSKITKIIK